MATQAAGHRVDFVGVPTRGPRASGRLLRGHARACGARSYSPSASFAEFETGNLTLSIFDPDEMGMEHHVSRNPIALHVEDMEAARGQLEQAGVEFRVSTFDTGVCHMAFFADPDGNALMLHHRYAPRSPRG